MNPDPSSETSPSPRFDVVIAGGGLAGLTLALQIRMELQDLNVAVIERTRRPLPPAAHKVGESSVELGSAYLERLGLREYLLDHHIVKFGLRLFPGGGQLPLQERLELGPGAEPVATSYQMDRGRLEEDLRAMIVDAGATLFEGARVRDVDLAPGETPHTIQVEMGGEPQTLTARWFVDATGRSALLRRRKGLGRASGHAASAGWFRVTGRLDVNEMVGDPDHPWRQLETAEDRWRSTNHFMGDGYWVWVLPLAGDRTSVGIVAHEERHTFEQIHTLAACRRFLEEHEPYLNAFLGAHLARGEEVLDFRCMKRYSHGIERSFSADRWAAVGEAGAFVDPLYSPGMDYIAIANTMTLELLRADLGGQDLAARCAELDGQYADFVEMGLTYFQAAGPVYGHPAAMTSKVYWDNFFYWNYHCQYFQQRIYALSGDDLAPFKAVGRRFLELSRCVQKVIRSWALLAPEVPSPGFIGMPAAGSLGVECHLGVLNDLSADEARAYMELRLEQAEEMAAEIVVRALTELGPERAQALIDQTGLLEGGPSLSRGHVERAAHPVNDPSAPRSPVAQDLAHNLHPLRPHPRAAEAVNLIFTRTA